MKAKDAKTNNKGTKFSHKIATEKLLQNMSLKGVNTVFSDE